MASATCMASSRGGREHEGVRLAQLRIDLLQDRQREGGGLSGAGLRLPDEVASGEHERNGPLLNGRRRLVSEGGEGLDDLGAKAEVGEWVGYDV